MIKGYDRFTIIQGAGLVVITVKNIGWQDYIGKTLKELLISYGLKIEKYLLQMMLEKGELVKRLQEIIEANGNK